MSRFATEPQALDYFRNRSIPFREYSWEIFLRPSVMLEPFPPASILPVPKLFSALEWPQKRLVRTQDGVRSAHPPFTFFVNVYSHFVQQRSCRQPAWATHALWF